MKPITDYYKTFFEMSFHRKDAEGEITALSKPVIEHVVKILTYEDEINYNKHINDINSWLYDIQNILIKKGRRPKQKDYYMWMFDEKIESLSDIELLINIKLIEYHKLKRIRTTREIYDVMKNIYSRLSADLSVKAFKTIKDYLP